MRTVKMMARTLWGLVLTGVLVIAGSGSAGADSITATNGSISEVVAGGDGASHVLSVLPSALQMSDHPNGQYVDYEVIAQDVTGTPSGFTYYPWQGPFAVNGIQWHDSYLTGAFSTSGPVDLGTYRITGLAGHHYKVWVQFAYWVGSSWVTVMVPVTSYLNTLYSNGVAFTLTNSFALT